MEEILPSSNNIIIMIKNNDEKLVLEEVLINKDFPILIEEESQVLYQKILSNNGEWMKKIIDYALFDLKPPINYLKFNRINQINRNASNFLGDCRQVFADHCIKADDNDFLFTFFFSRIVEQFIHKQNRTNTNRMYAGHFQRFIRNFLSLHLFNDEAKTIQKIIPFLINNCNILAYQQLIYNILCEFSTDISDKLVYDILEKILQCSYKAVQFSRRLENYYEDHPYIIKDKVNEKKILKRNQPFNSDKTPIPIQIFNFNETENTLDVDDPDAQIEWKSDIINNNNYNSQEDAEMTAYLLLMGLRTSIKNKTELLSYFRHDEKNNFLLIEALLYCGTYCSSKSIISLESFKILDIIFNGSITLNIDPWMLFEEEKINLNFYSKYANKLVFDSKDPTSQMINALPIFWNHRYNLDEYKMSEIEKKTIDVGDYYTEDRYKAKKFTREKGETALQILQPCLLSEPPLSSQLIFEVIRIFTRLQKRKLYLINLPSISSKDSDEMVSIDFALLDFYQHRFDLGKIKMGTFCEIARSLIPLQQSDSFYLEENFEKTRPVLNGFLMFFFTSMMDGFFDLHTPFIKDNFLTR